MGILPPSCKELVKASCEECTGVAECVYLTSQTTGFSICQDSDADLPVVPEANWRVFHNTSECSGGGENPNTNTTTTTTTTSTTTTTTITTTTTPETTTTANTTTTTTTTSTTTTA